MAQGNHEVKRLNDESTSRVVRIVKEDDALWLKHLARAGIVLPVGAGAIIQVNGVDVLFEPMRPSSSGRLTHGLKAAGSTREIWINIQKQTLVELRLVRVLDGASTSVAPVPRRPSAIAPAASEHGLTATRSIVLPVRHTLAFDAYVMVDWSASSVPNRGADSVWWCLWQWHGDELVERHVANPATRRDCIEALRSTLAGLAVAGRSVFVGFDFPFGYPTGFAKALQLNGTPWRATWQLLSERIQDRQTESANNRFEVASLLNAAIGAGAGPFWGRPTDKVQEHLQTTEPSYPVSGLLRLRETESRIRGPQPTWKLWGNGSVGSQSLLGVPYLNELRFNTLLAPVTRVWPFETGCVLPPRTDEPRLILAEIYPSLVPIAAETAQGDVKDRLQVAGIARHLARLDAEQMLDDLFEAPGWLPKDVRWRVLAEEGWILGVTIDSNL